MAESPFSDKDLKAALRDQLRDDLKRSLKEEESKVKPVRRIKWFRPAIAAALAIGIAAFLWLFYQPANTGYSPDGEELFAQFYQAFPNELYPIDLGQRDSTLKVTALQDYELGNYTDALRKIQDLPDSERNNDINFYEASTLLALDRLDEAEQIFKNIARDSEARYKQQSEWYLSLSNLKEGEIDEARNGLLQIAQAEGHPYREEAGSILQGLSIEK